MSGHHPSNGPSFIDQLEETFIALILGLMTLLTFANVIARYVFNSNILWGLEVTSILFAWLVIFGISYCVKKTAHLGVDAVVNLLSAPLRKGVTLLAALFCIVYAFLLLKGGWDFWANFANLPATTGRWLPTGFQEKFLAKGWYETSDVVIPQMLQFLSHWFNDGEAYEKLPRLVPYVILPVGMALLLYRFVQAAINIYRGRQAMLIVSHEAEEAVEAAAAKVREG